MLTKSDFLKYQQCPRYLWLHKHQSGLGQQEISENQQQVFNNGYLVEFYAEQLFPDGIKAWGEESTKKLITDQRSVIFQPTIKGSSLYCRSDIIQFNKAEQAWDIYEVKASAEIRDINFDDLAFQKICFQEAGYQVGQLYLVCVDNDYVRQGKVDPSKLLKIEEVSQRIIEREEKIKKDINQALSILRLKQQPEVRILKQCHQPYLCPFKNYCWQDIPANSIYDLAGGLSVKKLSQLLDQEVILIKDIPPGVITSQKGQRHFNLLNSGQSQIDLRSVKRELEKLIYPLYFIDYETYSPVVPLFDNYRPYQRIVFQYSLHIQDRLGGPLKHQAYLASELIDPSLSLVKNLQAVIGQVGSIIVWNKSFEQGCNNELAEHQPSTVDFFKNFNQRLFDLMEIFKKGYYDHPDFGGSVSLKKVLPVLVPKLSYNDLVISDGQTASCQWFRMVSLLPNQQQKEDLYNHLLKYCHLDTLAMVEILDFLYKLN